MIATERKSSTFRYFDSEGDGPVVVLLGGVLTGADLWDDVARQLVDSYRIVVPELPFGSHRVPFPDDADLTLPGIAKMLADFLVELDLHDVTLVSNDWGGAQLVVAPGGSDRVANLILVSCEAFDNYPPGINGRLLCLNASLPGGTFLTSQLLRPRFLRHLRIVFGPLSKKRIPNERFLPWIEPLRTNRAIRKNLNTYLTNVPSKKELNTWAQAQQSFQGNVLVVWSKEDQLIPPAHAERLAKHFTNTRLEWVEDSGTLITVDQPDILAKHMLSFLSNNTKSHATE